MYSDLIDNLISVRKGVYVHKTERVEHLAIFGTIREIHFSSIYVTNARVFGRYWNMKHSLWW